LIINHVGDTIKISIHTPAKGATAENMKLGKGIQISIHTPAKGATIESLIYS